MIFTTNHNVLTSSEMSFFLPTFGVLTLKEGEVLPSDLVSLYCCDWGEICYENFQNGMSLRVCTLSDQFIKLAVVLVEHQQQDAFAAANL